MIDRIDLIIWKNRTQEKVWHKLAWFLPDKLIYWASIRMIAYATQGKYGNTIVPDLTAMDAIGRWEKKGQQ